MIKIDVFIKEKKWKNHISDPKKYLENKIKKIKITKNLIKKKNFNFSIMLGGNQDIKILNKKFRKKNKTTDVLSFPFHDSKQIKKLNNKKSIYLGDVILNYYKISRKNFKKDFNKMNKLENLILKEVEKH